MSHHLSDRTKLRADLDAAPPYDVLLTEVKAAAVDLAVRSALAADREVVFSDNDLRGEGVGDAFDALLLRSGARVDDPEAGRQHR
jgi:predicted GTPase